MQTLQETKSLTADTLAKSCLDNSHKAALTKAFVASQRQHISVYAVEGRREFASCNRDSALELNPELRVAAQTSAPDGLSSPVLKPRNAGSCPSAAQCSKTSRTKDDSLGNEDKSAPKVQEEKKKRSPAKLQPARGTTTRSKDRVEITQEKHSGGTKTSRQSVKPRQKKRPHADSDEEKEERLAERRARRRSKKEITAPKVHEALTMSDPSEAEDTVEPTGKVSRKKDAKKNLPAGLALMHGFSATNVGKHRLTVVPMMTLGVFSKGRASAKTKIEKKSRSKALNAFDERSFLNKASPPFKPAHRTPNYGRNPGGLTDLQESSTISDAKTDLSCQQSRAEEKTPILHQSVVSQASSASPKPEHSGLDDEKSNYESEVWEIEKEFLPAACDDQDSGSLAKLGSIVIDSKGWGWTVPEPSDKACEASKDHSAPDGGLDKEPTLKEMSEIGSISSLRPSQSASQRPATPSVSLGAAQQKSKFFTSPKQVREDKECITIPKPIMPHCHNQGLKECSQLAREAHMSPLSHSEGLLIAPCERVREDVPDQIGGRECVTASSLSVENAIRDLEAEDYSFNGVRPVHCSTGLEFSCASGLNAGITLENDFRLAESLDFLDAGCSQPAGSCHNSFEIPDAIAAVDHLEFDNPMETDDYETQSFYGLGYEVVSGDDIRCLPEIAEASYYDDVEPDYPMDPEYGASIEEGSFHVNSSQDAMSFQSEEDNQARWHEIEDCEGSSCNYDATYDESYVSGSEDIQEEAWLSEPGLEGQGDFVPLGRPVHFGVSHIGAPLLLFHQSNSTEVFRSNGSLEEVEAVVAREFRKNLYPIKF